MDILNSGDLPNLPGIADSDLAMIAGGSTDPDIWTKAMLNSLSLWHDADEGDVRAWLTAFAASVQIEAWREA